MKDIILGLILIVISIAVLTISSSFPNFVVRGERLPGPKFFPTILAIVLICFALYCLLLGMVTLRNSRKPSGNLDNSCTPAGIINILCISLSVFFFVPIISLVGTLVGITVIGTALMTLLSIKWYQSLMYSSALAFLVYIIFQIVFKVPLPEGILFSFVVR
ncbi:MAG: tripartite tricarboxylate transporter TctB family protein [Pseudothermotoga sp.]